MNSDYKELYFIFGAIIFIIVSATVGLVLFVKYLNRDSRDQKHTKHQK
jgi:hypothetical protein